MNTRQKLILVATAVMLLVFTGGLFAAGQAETDKAEPVTLNVHQAGIRHSSILRPTGTTK